MITVPEVVEEIIKRSPFLEDALARNLINLSSLARDLKPEIQKKLYKDIEVGAIVMALKRLSIKKTKADTRLQSILKNLGDITVRSNIVEFTFANSPTLDKRLEQIVDAKNAKPNSFLTFTEGILETSIFASLNLQKEIEAIFKQEALKNKLTNLSSITIIIPEEATYVPGVYYSILKTLAWEGINFIDVVSSYTELTISMEEKDIDRAFSALKNI